MLNRIIQAGRYVSQSLRLMVGMPEYDIYVTMQDKHPGQAGHVL